MKKSKIFLNLTSFFCFVYFAIYTFTLVFIPIGVYCFVAGKNFSYKADHLDDTYKMSNVYFKRYVIFVSIFCFPFGLFSIIPYLYLSSNNVKVSDLHYVNLETSAKNSTENSNLESSKVSNEEKNNAVEENKQVQETEEEKLEKFKKLENFKEKGFITEQELEQAREQIFGKKG